MIDDIAYAVSTLLMFLGLGFVTWQAVAWVRDR